MEKEPKDSKSHINYMVYIVAFVFGDHFQIDMIAYAYLSMLCSASSCCRSSLKTHESFYNRKFDSGTFHNNVNLISGYLIYLSVLLIITVVDPWGWGFGG